MKYVSIVVSNPQEKSDLAKKIEGYMTRAEFIKSTSTKKKPPPPPLPQPPLLRSANDPLAHMILDEVLDNSPGVHWNDIAGLDRAKQVLKVRKHDTYEYQFDTIYT
jgi:hypothetical protein